MAGPERGRPRAARNFLSNFLSQFFVWGSEALRLLHLQAVRCSDRSAAAALGDCPFAPIIVS
jgi:hypothetical protein